MRRLAVVGALVWLLCGTGVAAAASGTAAAPSSPAAASTTPAPSASGSAASAGSGAAASTGSAVDPLCNAEIDDPAGVLSGDDVEQLRLEAQDLAQTTVLRLRTVSSVPGSDLNAYEKQLQQSCRWADASNVRQPTLLVLMVDTDDRQIGIYPGPSLTPVLTDGVWLTIEQERMRPLFADGDWTGGLQAGVDALAALVGPGADPSATTQGGQGVEASAPAVASPSASSFLQYDANGNLVQGDGTAEHPFVNGVGASSSSSSAVGPVIGVVAVVVVLGVIAAVARGAFGSRGFGGARRNGFWDGGSTTQLGALDHGGSGGFSGGSDGGGGGFSSDGGGGGSSSDGGGGSSGF